MGQIVIILSCLPSYEDREDNYILETEIIDTGVGISQERQSMLFVPFLELKMKQNMNKVQDGNIGMGLAGSVAISKEMGGDISIKHSERHLTIFSFRIPVKADETDSICTLQGELFDQ